MNTTTEKVKNNQYHDYAGSVATASLVIATTANTLAKANNKDALEVNLANHIEAFCDCV